MSERKELDLAVIGAGWHGLAAAKVYLELNPTSRIAIYASEATIGGVWSEERLYPGLKSNDLYGMFEYSDFPMDSETYGIKTGQYVPAETLHRYLTDYAKKFTLFDKTEFSTKVEKAQHQENGGWLLTISKIGAASPGETLYAKKLVVATGLTSEPSLAKFKGSEEFGAPFFHPKYFQQHAKNLETAKRVTIFGGSKSAWDAAYEHAIRGVKVDWIIRESGHGPTWMAPSYVTPLKRWIEALVHTRFLTWLSPCVWGDADDYSRMRSLLHRTKIGRFIVNSFWDILGNDVLTLNNYDAHPEMAKLKPWIKPFNMAATSCSILNYDTDFFQLVKNGTIKVYITEIDHLSKKTVHLANGTTLETDALIGATGWRQVPPLQFLPSELNLGLPGSSTSTKYWNLVKAVDADILKQFPRLASQPPPNPKAKPPPVNNQEHANVQYSPYNLYRFIVPPSATTQRDIAFSGFLMSFSTPMIAQTQALWIASYFAGDLVLPEQDKVEYEAALHNRYGKWRYPAEFGHKFPDFVFDALPYLDLLLKDLGLRRWRKANALREIGEPYSPADYRGLVGEWLEGRKKDL